MATIKEALKFPLASFKRLFNFYWGLIPLWGWFILCGYFVREMRSVFLGKVDELPAVRPFKGQFMSGLLLFLVHIVLLSLLYFVLFVPYIGWVLFALIVFVYPVLLLQYANTTQFLEGLNLIEASITAFSNFGKYVLTWLKVLLVSFIWSVLSIPVITVIVTLPAMKYSAIFLYADFYRELHGNARRSKPTARESVKTPASPSSTKKKTVRKSPSKKPVVKKVKKKSMHHRAGKAVKAKHSGHKHHPKRKHHK